MKDRFTVTELANILEVYPETVRRWQRSGKLHSQHRIHQDLFSADREQIGGVTEPHKPIFVRRQAREIGFDDFNGIFRHPLIGFVGQEVPDSHQTGFPLAGELGRKEFVRIVLACSSERMRTESRMVKHPQHYQ